MGAVVNAIRFAKAVAPQIAKSPLQAPQIISRYLSGQALAALIDLIDITDDITPPAPQFRAPAGPPPQPASYNVMAPGPHNFAPPAGSGAGPGATYGTMAPPQQYRNLTVKTPYGAMAPRPQVQYGTMAPPAPPQFNPAGPPTLPAGHLPGTNGYTIISPAVVPIAAPTPLSSSAAGAVPTLDPRTIPLLAMPHHHLVSDQSKGVKYVTDVFTRVNKYAVTMNKTVTRRGIALDTADVKSHFMNNKGVFAGIAILGHDKADHDARFQKLANEWGYQSLIWVCVKEARSSQAIFYSHMGKSDRFHHSSFTAGGDVIGAGEWIIQKGHLLKVSANSGHYRPPLDYFHRAVLLMSAAWQRDTTVLLWNIKKDTYEDVPVLVFAKNPSGGGIYKTSPKAA